MAVKKTKRSKNQNDNKSAPKKKTKKTITPLQKIKNFYKEWKTTGIVFAVIFLVFYLKIKEEGNSYIHGKQSEEDLYGILDLSSSATIKQIKVSYNKMVKDFHPDKNPSCTICPEKFSKISRAYEILSNKESKIHYDQTNGILEPLESKTQSLYSFNFHHLVEESPKPWIIQVYSENDSSSRTFSGFWEEFALKHSYLNFGRINFGSQKALLKKLPYAVGELPLVISLVPGEHPELYGFYGDRSPNSGLERFLRKSFRHKYSKINSTEFAENYVKKGDKGKLVLIGFSNIPTVFLYISSYYGKSFDYFLTELGQAKQVRSIVKNEKTIAVYTPPKDLDTPIRNFEGKQNKIKLISITKYMHFMSIPELHRFSFQDYCEISLTASSKESYTNLPIGCIIGIQDSNEYPEVEKLMKRKIIQMEEEMYQRAFKIKKDLNAHLNKLQFAKISLKANKRFKKQIIEKFNIKNPKYIVFISDLNMIGVFNNLDEFDDIYQDLIEGVYEEFRPLKELLKKDGDISLLLVNEKMTAYNIIENEVCSGLGFKFLVLLALFIFCYKYLRYGENKAGICSIGAVVVYSSFCILLKMFNEEFF